MGSLRVAVERREPGLECVRLAGSISEGADLAGMFANIKSDVVINMREVERMNSMGVHRWIPLLEECGRRVTVLLEELSYAVVMQANCVANLIRPTAVRSLMAPYFCSQCNQARMMVVPAAEVATTTGVPARTCEACGASMEFDELDNYFAFLRRSSGL
jgi:hypothetical protein